MWVASVLQPVLANASEGFVPWHTTASFGLRDKRLLLGNLGLGDAPHCHLAGAGSDIDETTMAAESLNRLCTIPGQSFFCVSSVMHEDWARVDKASFEVNSPVKAGLGDFVRLASLCCSRARRSSAFDVITKVSFCESACMLARSSVRMVPSACKTLAGSKMPGFNRTPFQDFIFLAAPETEDMLSSKLKGLKKCRPGQWVTQPCGGQFSRHTLPVCRWKVLCGADRGWRNHLCRPPVKDGLHHPHTHRTH